VKLRAPPVGQLPVEERAVQPERLHTRAMRAFVRVERAQDTSIERVISG
jgi:hypothetical protein